MSTELGFNGGPEPLIENVMIKGDSQVDRKREHLAGLMKVMRWCGERLCGVTTSACATRSIRLRKQHSAPDSG